MRDGGRLELGSPLRAGWMRSVDVVEVAWSKIGFVLAKKGPPFCAFAGETARSETVEVLDVAHIVVPFRLD